MNISYDHYRVFCYVARYQNVTLAANALVSNQPNVTRIIRNLERALGCTLLIRSNRGVRLTPEGEKLYARVKIAVEQIEAAEEELSSCRMLQSGMISVGATEVALRCFLLPVLNDFRRCYPGVRLNISNYTTYQAIAALKSGQVDIAVVTTPMGDLKGLRARELLCVREVPVCGDYFAEAAQRDLTVKELTEYPLVCLGPSTKTHERYSKWFAEQGADFSPAIEAATAGQILPMVKNNLGIGFVPEEFLSEDDGQGVYRLSLKEPVPERSIQLLKRADGGLSTAAKKLEQQLLEHKTVQQ